MINYKNNATIDFFGPVDVENIDLEGFAKELNKVQGQDLEILINSPGGDIFDGVAIADIIQRRKEKTTTTAIGLAASIATVILMAGDIVQMSESATIMIHDAWTFEAGDSDTLKKTAETLDKISDTIANIYTNQLEKTGKLLNNSREETKEMFREMMKAETWFDAKEALELGLIDKIVKPVPDTVFTFGAEGMSDASKFSAFKNTLRTYKNVPTKIFNKYNTQKMQDKKSIWAALKAFFVSEIKEEAKEEEKVAQEKNQNNLEKIKAKLIENGFEVKEKKITEPDFIEKENSELTEIKNKLDAVLKSNSKLKEELKEAKFKAASKPSSNEIKDSADAKNKISISKDNKNAFSALANYIKHN